MSRVRSRMFKPELTQELGSLAFKERELLRNLAHLADDEGRLREIETTIIAQAFPHDGISPRELRKLLGRLAIHGPASGDAWIVRYEVGGQQFISLPRFTDPEHVFGQAVPPSKAKSSTLPPPPEGEIHPEQGVFGWSAPTTSEPRNGSRPAAARQHDGSQDAALREGKGREGKEAHTS